MKTLILFRGIPGSGKSTLANLLVEHTVAVDDFMVNDKGEYEFRQERLAQCQDLCQNQVRQWMENSVDKIAVHNTFVRHWELQPYKMMAEQYGYRVHIVTVENHHGSANEHNIPLGVIERMAKRWKISNKWPNKRDSMDYYLSV